MAIKKAAKKKIPAKKKAVVKKKSNLPMKLDFAADAGAGLETIDKDSVAIPFLRVIQKMSPQVDEDESVYMEDAKPGMLLNSVTNELFDGKKGIVFLACAFRRVFLKWGARGTDSSGYKGEFPPEVASKMLLDGEVVEHKGKLYFPDDDKKIDPETSDQLVDTRNHFGLILEEDGTVSQVLLTISSTQIKKSKQLVSMLNAIKIDGPVGRVTPPTWVNRIIIKTIPEKNDKGSWHGVTFQLDGFIDSQEVYDDARYFHNAIGAGAVDVNYTDSEEVKGDEKF